MEKKMKIAAVSLAALFFLLIPKIDGQLFRPANPLPLCASQFALANYACSRLPLSPPAPIPSPPSPSPPDEDGGDEEQNHRHGHRHGRHHHRHHNVREQTPAEENCCRWARDVDNQCVCEILARLPDFLARAAHQYIVSVGDSCQITYSCGGRIKI